MEAIEVRPPEILVVTDDQCFTMNRGFDYLDRWPQFVALLGSEYTMIGQRTPLHTVGWWRHPAQPFSYRIYVRRDVPPEIKRARLQDPSTLKFFSRTTHVPALPTGIETR
jgi:hypothetical protein